MQEFDFIFRLQLINLTLTWLLPTTHTPLQRTFDAVLPFAAIGRTHETCTEFNDHCSQLEGYRYRNQSNKRNYSLARSLVRSHSHDNKANNKKKKTKNNVLPIASITKKTHNKR